MTVSYQSALYQRPNGQPAPANNGNIGLWYDKYCDRWPIINGKDRWSLKTEKVGNTEIHPKQDWIDTVVGTAGDSDQIAEACQRLADMADQLGVKTPQFFKTQWRFVTGLGRQHPVENGFAWHQTLGTPYLPGSSVKGMVRAWAEHWLLTEVKDADLKKKKEAEIRRIFGPRGMGEVGSVIFFDALPIHEVLLEKDIMTPHYAPYYSDGDAPGDWYDPTPIPFLTVAPDQTFQFLITPRLPEDEQSRDDAEQARVWLTDALEWIGAGAKTAVGYGRMEKQADEEVASLKAAIMAASVCCDWVDETIAEISESTHSPAEMVLRGKALAEAWQALEDDALKRNAFTDIKARWQKYEWWEKANGKSMKKAYSIYVEYENENT